MLCTVGVKTHNSERQIDWYKVGWVKRAHGIKGELYIQLLSKTADWLEDLKIFQLKPLPGGREDPQVLTLKRVKPHKQGLILLPEGFSHRNQSELWKGSDFLIDKAILQTEDGEKPYLIEFEGFTVEDVRLGVVGVVEGFMDNGAQDLLLVKPPHGEEVLIPFVDAFLLDSNKKERTLKMNLPEGLVDAGQSDHNFS